ncbi:helix-turn-helix domain-containing protein [Streptomyces sp. bgisy032]|uniref:transcriptional regulator n=1 Tax=Streptomyces sp. bgisy032 TaxID=3413773 RepID=UPI003D73C2C6
MSAHEDLGDVGEFAALLRSLKDRTDRSYGSLARRLAMNTSTLHRYCAGDAVPVDFAPVERFAALCGASPEERLELHRRWLAAVAARQRPRTAAAAGTPGEEPVTDSASDEAPGAEEHGRESGQKPGQEHGRKPGQDDRQEPGQEHGEHGREPGQEQGRDAPGSAAGPADAPAGPADAPAGPAEAPDGPVDAPDGPADAPGGAPARPGYRRRRVTIGLAAACAVLATLGSLAALPDGRRASAGDRAGTASGPAATGTARAEASAGRSASPTPGGSPASGRPSPSATPPEEKAAPSPSVRGTTAPPDRGTAATPPLAWSADSQAWKAGCGHDYVIAKPPGQVPPPPAPQDAGTWAATQGAVHAGETVVRLTVQGLSDTAVVLEALRVRVSGRQEPARGNAYAMDQGCGGALTPRYFDVDLDKDRPLARPVAGSDAGTPIPAVSLPYRVSARDPEVLLVTARTQGCDCRWYLELDWSSQGRRGTVRVDDGGSPFRTSALKGLPRYMYDTSARQWTPYG